MRPLWKGAVSFGLVYVPVKMYAATEKKNIKFNYLHEKCKTPIQYRRYCPYCDTEVANEKILQDGKPSFSALQTRGKISDALKVKRLSRQIPATFIAFDVLYKAGENVMGMTTREKKQLLEEIVERGPDLIISQYVVGSGVDFYRAVTAAGLEGMVAKRLDSPCLPGKRSPAWKRSGWCSPRSGLFAVGKRGRSREAWAPSSWQGIRTESGFDVTSVA
ncbi:MAG: Ku protein [Bacillota bacterium]